MRVRGKCPTDGLEYDRQGHDWTTLIFSCLDMRRRLPSLILFIRLKMKTSMSLSFLLLPTLFNLILTATIRVSDAEPPLESYWNSFDSQQFYLNSSVKTSNKERLITVRYSCDHPSSHVIILHSSTGSVIGRLIHTYRNRSALAFLGIPYAETPEYSGSEDDSSLWL